MPGYHLSNFDREVLNKMLVYTPSKRLSATQVEFLDSKNRVVASYSFSDLSPFLWGMLYERVVGIYYEKSGYDVEYNGIINGVLDQGIDLICCKPDQPTCYVQCKSGQKHIGKQGIETILYKGGNYISKVERRRCRFVLVIESEKMLADVNRRRFLHWNKHQSKVKLEVKTLTW